VRGWWASKLKRTWTYLRASVSEAELSYLADWLRPPEFALFEAMPVADQRHGIDVQRALGQMGVIDRDVLCAGLLHDCGKRRSTRLPHRVAWSLGQRYGAWVWRLAVVLPTFKKGLWQMRYHAELSARLAAEAGCSPRTVDLIRQAEKPVDEDGRMLLAADEAC
jgi:hypothetical protein